jgi:RNA polymerase subunit RPABC4/transcription elongation factor Spt4
MAEKMIKCHACNKEIASSAKTCPSCGAKQKKPIFKKWWFWVLIVIFIGIIIPKGEKNADDATPNNNQQEEVVEGSVGKPYPKDQKVTVGEIDWQIVSVENIGSVIDSGNQFIDDCKADSGSFVKLVVKVKNNRKDLFSITDLTLVDNQERRFVTSSDVFSCVDDTVFLLDNINPGIEKTFTAIYEIPEGTTGLMLEVNSTGSLFSGETNKYISLGL